MAGAKVRIPAELPKERAVCQECQTALPSASLCPDRPGFEGQCYAKAVKMWEGEREGPVGKEVPALGAALLRAPNTASLQDQSCRDMGSNETSHEVPTSHRHLLPTRMENPGSTWARAVGFLWPLKWPGIDWARKRCHELLRQHSLQQFPRALDTCQLLPVFLQLCPYWFSSVTLPT